MPTNPAGQNIHITGYGLDARRTRSQVQQTHVGPLLAVSIKPATLLYRTDTRGGNSGSPVIHENTGSVVGIHTNGGCDTRSNSANQGTRIDRSNLQAAIQKLLSKPGKLESFGSGCPGSQGVPKLDASEIPQIGRFVALVAQRVPSSAPGLMILGVSNTVAGSQNLPFDLAPLGMPTSRSWRAARSG